MEIFKIHSFIDRYMIKKQLLGQCCSNNESRFKYLFSFSRPENLDPDSYINQKGKDSHKI